MRFAANAVPACSCLLQPTGIARAIFRMRFAANAVPARSCGLQPAVRIHTNSWAVNTAQAPQAEACGYALSRYSRANRSSLVMCDKRSCAHRSHRRTHASFRDSTKFHSPMMFRLKQVSRIKLDIVSNQHRSIFVFKGCLLVMTLLALDVLLHHFNL